MHGFTKALALEVARKGVTVNTISPGYIGTKMVMAIPKDVLDSKIIPQIPMGRLGKPEEVAGLVAYLCERGSGVRHRRQHRDQRRPAHVLSVTARWRLAGSGRGPGYPGRPRSDARRIAVSSSKAVLGHGLGAAGALEMAVTALAVHSQTIPPQSISRRSIPTVISMSCRMSLDKRRSMSRCRTPSPSAG